MAPDASHFFIFYVITMLMTNVCISFGYMISAASPDINVALILGGALFFPLSILGGFLIPVE